MTQRYLAEIVDNSGKVIGTYLLDPDRFGKSTEPTRNVRMSTGDPHNNQSLPPMFRNALRASQEEPQLADPLARTLSLHTPLSIYTWQKMLDPLNNAETQQISEWLLQQEEPEPPSLLKRFLAYFRK